MPMQQGVLSRAALYAAVNKAKFTPPPRPIIKPRVTPPMKPEEILNKLGKLASDFENPSRFVTTSNELVNLITRGLTKDNSTKFFEVLQKLSPLIGSPEYNSVAMSRIFDAANAKAPLFAAEEAESVAKWKSELDAKKPKPSMPIYGKRPIDDQSGSSKKLRPEPTVESILLKRIDTLEDEVSKLRDELLKTKVRHGKQLAQIRIDLGLPAPLEDFDGHENAVVPAPAETAVGPADGSVPAEGSAAEGAEGSAPAASATEGGAEGTTEGDAAVVEVAEEDSADVDMNGALDL